VGDLEFRQRKRKTIQSQGQRGKKDHGKVLQWGSAGSKKKTASKKIHLSTHGGGRCFGETTGRVKNRDKKQKITILLGRKKTKDNVGARQKKRGKSSQRRDG